MNGDLDDKQGIVQRFGQQEAYRSFIGHGQQAMVSFKKQAVALGAYDFAFRQPGQRRNLAKRLGRRALNRGQERNVVLLSQAKSRCGGYSVIFIASA
jgi:hypothetical protein